jgi:hypothetical protein
MHQKYFRKFIRMVGGKIVLLLAMYIRYNHCDNNATTA